MAPGKRGEFSVWWFSYLFASAAVVLNATLLLIAKHDVDSREPGVRNLTALMIAFVFSPALNVFAAIVGGIIVGMSRRRRDPLLEYVVVAIVLSLAAIAVDFAIIQSIVPARGSGPGMAPI
jgi:hypothetical protein